MTYAPQTIVEPPLVVEHPDTADWTASAEVVVVGQGGAGLCAALEARALGSSVLAIDRFGGGGSTAFSGGIFYAGETRWQKEGGVSDSKEEMYQYLQIELKDAVKPETLKKYCYGADKDLEWLAEHGVPFRGDAYLEKTAYPPEGKFLYYSGNENVTGYKEKAKPAPRGHRVVAKGFSGYAYYAGISAAADRAGVQRMMHARVMRLVTDTLGQVIGVEILRIESAKGQAEHAREARRVIPLKPFNADGAQKAIAEARRIEGAYGVRRLIRARGGVILATGGFNYDLEYMAKHLPIYGRNYRSLIRMGSIGCDGSGMRLGESVGGTLAYMDNLYSAKVLSPPKELLNGILVNTAGSRFVNEEIYTGYLGRAIGREADGQAWLILERKSLRKAILQCFQAGWTARLFTGPVLLNILFGKTKGASTLPGLARKCGISPSGLGKAVEEYNRAIAQNAPDPWGKKTRHPIKRGPFRALDLSIKGKFGFTMVITLGGLRVNEETGNVIRPDGSVIDGLYAAGRAAVGLCAIGYFSGVSLSDGVFSGRRAGEAASARAARLHD
jgi:3-oxo-5alpha-steroid 4-dehydrogenase